MIHLLLAIIYLAFISLGLPDALLGSAWPSMYQEFSVPVSYSGMIFMIIAAGTVISSLQSDRLTKWLGTGKVTAISVLMTAVALFGFSISDSFPALCLWAVPYGLGAGSVDAALNNYVALHYKSRHMSWLHCMWGIGASVGPYIMGWMLTGGFGWNMGYRTISFLQVGLTVLLFVSLPLWRKQTTEVPDDSEISAAPEKEGRALSLREIIRIPGAKEMMFAFFCYSAVEQTVSLWASGYLVFHMGMSAENAAGFAGLFFIGITAGRFLSGFMTLKFNDTQMIRLGQVFILIGIIALVLPFGEMAALAGLLLLGFGCAPIYPSIIHSTPDNFGKDKSQAVMGVQMAFAYVGTLLMPPVFGFIANGISVSLFPVYLLLALAVMVFMHEKMLLKKRGFGRKRMRCGQAVLLTQEALRANLAEAVLYADHFHRNRAVLDDNVSHRRTQAALDLMVLSSNDRAALLGRVDDQLLIERLPGEHIDDLGGNTLGLELLLRLERFVNHDAGSDDRNVLAFLQGYALADLEVRAVRVNRSERLADHTHVRELAGSGQLLGQAVDLRIVDRVDYDRTRNRHVQRAVLKRHVGAAVISRAYARVRADHMYRQLCISRRHKGLVKRTAGSEAAERVHEHGLAGRAQAGSYAHRVCFRNTCIDGALRERLRQLAGVDAVLQVAVNVHDRGILLHDLEHRGNVAVAVCTRILFMLANQSKAHVHTLPYCALISASLLSA